MGRSPFPGESRSVPVAALLVALVLLTAGCAPQRVAFTQGIRARYGLGSEELKNLQYYVSSDITLQREFRREEGKISTGHNLVAKESGLLEQVIVRERTPGVATEVGDTFLAVSFEPGMSLIFGSPPGDWDPERKYRLLATRWTAAYGEIDYGGKIFHAVGDSRAAYLEIGVESLDAVKKRKTVLPGMTLPVE
jgi:hypothetical protein